MPASIISTDDTEFDPELIALADEFDSLDAEEQRIEAEGTRIAAWKTHIHVRQGRILAAARDRLTCNQDYGAWRNSRASLQKMENQTANKLMAYVDLLPSSPRGENEDTSNYPTEKMIRPFTAQKFPKDVARKLVEDHINGGEQITRALVREERDKYMPALPPPQVSMADRATIELRMAEDPHLEGEQLLGIGHGACKDAIMIVAKAFRQKYHPDKGGSPLDYHRINDAAAEVLKNVR